MKKILTLIILLGVLFSLGCTDSTKDIEVENSNSENSIQQEPDFQETEKIVPIPSSTIAVYKLYFNKVQTASLYDELLSKELQSTRSKDEVHNLIYAYSLQGLQIADYTIVDETVDDEKAHLEIEFTWNVQGYQKTVSKNIDLVLEDNKWKIDKELITM